MGVEVLLDHWSQEIRRSVSEKLTCRERADASHGRNESSVQIVVAHTKLEGEKVYLCPL